MADKVDTAVVESVKDNIANRNLNVMTPEQQADWEDANKANSIFQYCLTGRRPAEIEWFINDTYYEDRQTLRFNVSQNRIENLPADKQASRINVNKSKQLVRGVVSFLNREHPMITITPGPNSTSEDAYSAAKVEQQLAYHWYDHLQLNRFNKKVTSSGVKYGIGWGKVLWNQDATAPTTPYTLDGETKDVIEGEVGVYHSNTYDVYPDHRATSKEDMRFINEAFPRTLGELHANKRYDQNMVDLVAADDKYSVSTLKGNGLNASWKTAEMAANSDPMQRTGIIRETYVKEYNMDTEEWEIVLYVTTESNLKLLKEVWPLDEFPYEYYQTDVADGVFDSYGAIRDVRGLQHALSRGASQVEETMQTMGKINWLIPRGSGINVITDRTGQFVQYNPAVGVPHQSASANLPNYTETHMSNLERWIDDIGGAHDATYGRLPTNRASGELVNKLQEGDSNSLGMYKDNLEDFEVRIFKLMFKTAKYHYRTNRKIPLSSRDATGQYSSIELSGKDIALQDKVQVRTGSILPWNQEDRITMATDMHKEGMLTTTQAQRMIGLPDLDNVMGSDQLDIERQIEENKRLIAGEEIDDPVIAEGHDVHVQTIDDLIKSARWWEFDDKVKSAIMDHRMKHIRLKIQLAQLAAGMNYDKIKRQINMTVRENTTNDMSPIEKTQWWNKFGVESDGAEIQVRGGMNIQDANEAMNQAHLENQLMAGGEPVKIALGDNHQVHGEVHDAFMMDPEFALLPKSAQSRITEHRKQHDQIAQTVKPAPGLVPNSETGMPVPDHSLNTAAMKKKHKGQPTAMEAEAKANPQVPHPSEPAIN